MVIALLIASGAVSIYLLRDNFYREYPVYQDSADWIRQNVPENTLIFAGDWDDNVILFYYLPHYKFLVMLDPYFMYAYSPEKFRIWQKIVNGKVENSAEAIISNFDTHTVFVPPDRQKLKHRLLMDTEAEPVYKGKTGEMVFLLKSEKEKRK